jgi:Predicted permease
MPFDISAFVRTNRIFFIWTALAALVYMVRGLFGLVFITYVMCFVVHSAVGPLERGLKLNRRFLVVLMYISALLFMGFFLFFLMPTLAREAKEFTGQFSRAINVLDAWTARLAGDYAWISPALAQIREYLTPEQVLARVWGILRSVLERGLQYTSWFFLGLMFSFMIMLDLPRILRSVRSLRRTRLAGFYEETADSVVLFARGIGEYFQAQIVISFIDAVIIAVGLFFLGVNNLVLLSTLVFVCGLIPVLGVILSSVPILLMAVNSGGVGMAGWAMALIAVVSLFETYVLSPRIVSSVMSMNPAFTLAILYIAYNLFGMWGMLLGVPVAVYIHRRIMVPPAERA